MSNEKQTSSETDDTKPQRGSLSGATPCSAGFDQTARSPINQQAANLFVKGEKYHNEKKITCRHWIAAPPLKQPGPDDLNLTGMRIGRLEVIGLHQDLIGRWVVRCACGNYEVRRAKSIRNPNNFGDRCEKCRQVAYEKKNYTYNQTGREIDVRKL